MGTKTLKEIVVEFAGRTGLPIPTTVAGNNDAQVRQVLGLLNEGMEDLTTRKRLQAIHRTATHTSLGGGDQGALEDLCPIGYESIIPETMWDGTNQMYIPVVHTAEEWRNIVVGMGPTPYGKFRVLNNHLWFTPDFPEDHEITWEYESRWYVQDAVGTGKEYFTADTDIFLLSDRIAIAWLRWAWKKEKGLEYAEEFNKYELLVATKEMRDAPAKVLDFACASPRHGILIPQTGAGGGGSSGGGGSGGGGVTVIGDGGTVIGAN